MDKGEYNKTDEAAWGEYGKARQAAMAKCRKAVEAAWGEYQEAEQAADAKRLKAEDGLHA